MSIKLLLAADDEPSCAFAHDLLTQEEYQVFDAFTHEEALALLRKHRDLSLVILGVTAQPEQGLALCRKIRACSDVPLLFAVNPDDEETKLGAYAGGADCVFARGQSVRVFLACVHALLRRLALPSERLELDSLTIDLRAGFAAVGGQKLDLTPKEFSLLCFLAQNRNVVKSREQILHAVWDTEFFGDARTVDTHMKNLRHKLGPESKLLRTVRSRGYILEYRP